MKCLCDRKKLFINSKVIFTISCLALTLAPPPEFYFSNVTGLLLNQALKAFH